MTLLHITNGDSAASLLEQSAVSGAVLPWRDPMHHGPFPADLPLEALSEVRAKYLAGPDVDTEKHIDWFRFRDARLRSAQAYERVVLWFEHDLLDQLQILQLLDWFAVQALGDTSLELVCIDRFPGIDPFRGLGQLDSDQIGTLDAMRRAVSPNMLELASAGWSAFRSDNPRDLLVFLERDLTELPFLRPALLRHLEEYPSAKSGLTRTEAQLLALAGDAVQSPGELFLRNMDFETALYIGDLRTFSTIADLCAAGLLECSSGRFWYPPQSKEEVMAFREQRLTLSALGEKVLHGDSHAFALMDRDCWLGGVRLLTDGQIWSWDREAHDFSKHPLPS
ncbi:MAG: hypothetical protein AAGC81_13380 [Pseudomonadota bacterium]